jgi:hypothetical protein
MGDKGMPAYAYGPGLLAVSHGPKEFIHTDRMVDCAPIYSRTAAMVLRPRTADHVPIRDAVTWSGTESPVQSPASVFEDCYPVAERKCETPMLRRIVSSAVGCDLM